MEKHLALEDGTVYYQLKGNGPSIVFIHGFLESHSIWDYFAKEMSYNYQVITIDLPGFGNSSVFAETHTMESMAEIVNKILEKEKIQDCIVVGHSMGGYVSLALAEKYPEKIEGIVLFHSHAEEDSKEDKTATGRLKW